MEDFELRSHVLYSQTLIDALKIEFYPKQSDLRNLLTLKKLLFLPKFKILHDKSKSIFSTKFAKSILFNSNALL
jgi:hypothetical protein